jgi:hypothetical protein
MFGDVIKTPRGINFLSIGGILLFSAALGMHKASASTHERASPPWKTPINGISRRRSIELQTFLTIRSFSHEPLQNSVSTLISGDPEAIHTAI